MATALKQKTITMDDVPWAVDGIYFVPPTIVHADPDQPRLAPDEELTASIAELGVQVPIIVRPHPELADEWMIVDGERRWRGAMAAKSPEIPIAIRMDLEERGDRLLLQVVTNKGKPLTPFEEGVAWKEILDEKGWSQSKLADVLGVPRSSVGDRVRIASLPEPWQQLLAGEKLTVSQAVELTKYSGLPADVHEAAAAEMQDTYWWDKEIGARSVATDRFPGNLAQVFQPFMHPLEEPWGFGVTPLPAAIVKRHDKECGCGRVTVAAWGGKATDRCGNPEWWKPAVQEARTVLAQREEKTEAKRAENAPTTLTLPEGIKTEPWAGYGKPPKGTIVLTKGDRWATHDWGRIAFDPADLTIDDTKLKRWAAGHGSEGVLTTDIAAVKAANAKWNERWAARLAEVQREIAERLTTALPHYNIPAAAGGAARQLLLALVGDSDWIDDEQILHEIIEAAALVSVPVPDDARPDPDDMDYATKPRNVLDPFRTWLGAITRGEAAGIATVFAAKRGERITTADAAVEKERRAALREIADRKTPWAEAPAAGSGDDDFEGDADGDLQDDEGIPLDLGEEDEAFADSSDDLWDAEEGE